MTAADIAIILKPVLLIAGFLIGFCLAELFRRK
jgi:hypothetical protein